MTPYFYVERRTSAMSYLEDIRTDENKEYTLVTSEKDIRETLELIRKNRPDV